MSKYIIGICAVQFQFKWSHVNPVQLLSGITFEITECTSSLETFSVSFDMFLAGHVKITCS